MPSSTRNDGGARGLLEIDPDALRASLLTLILRISTVCGFCVCVPSMAFAFAHGIYRVCVLDGVVMSLIVTLTVLTRLPFRVRATAFGLVVYGLGAGLLFSVGSISQLFLFAFSIVTVLLLGLRVALGAVALSSLTLFAVGLLGGAAPEMAVPSYHFELTAWFVITINFTMVDGLLTVAVGAVLAAHDKALARETASRVALAGERNLLRTLFDVMPDLVFTKDAQGRFVTCNPATLALVGLQREEQIAGKTELDLYPRDIAQALRAGDVDVIAGRPLRNREERLVDREGHPLCYLTTKVPLRDAVGSVVGFVGVSRDVTELKRAEAERAGLLAQLTLQIERMPLAYLLTDRDFRFTRWNPAAERMFGYREDEVLGRMSLDVIFADASKASVERTCEELRAGSMTASGEFENRTKDGRNITCDWHNTPMFDEAGAFTGILALAEDVSGRKSLEVQLRQSQKMDAVGRLAGGIAHDFNNLLSVVLSYSDLALTDLKPSDPLRNDLGEIHRAGQRAAELTQQLLMFSRQQVVAPKVLDLNEVLAGVDKMLQRVVGEDVELTTVAALGLGRVRIDPGALEQVIMNLAVNARDAMPTGGKLTMATANVTLDADYAKTHLGAKPGPYVLLSVSDTGTGIDTATLARVFEPFFTTKELGKGTGLGLSTVFGIVEQSGGCVWVFSKPGFGTTFEIYLPRVEEAVEEAPPASALATARGTETLLLVEDEDAVRAVAQGILRRHGYVVLAAHDGEEALSLSEHHEGKIDLLLSDVVMPKMSGPALAKLLAGVRPAMRVLFMSGYTDDAAVRHGVLGAELSYLQKPLTVETLTRKVRAVLDEHATRA
jgi:PAS domain S-box-containing protein